MLTLTNDGLDALIERCRGGGDIAVIADDVIAPDAALRPVTDTEFPGSVLLTRPAHTDADLRVRHHLVVAAGSNFHQLRHANQRMVGALRIAAGDCSTAVTALTDLRAARADGSVPSGDLFAQVVVALVRHGIHLRAVPMVDVPWFRNPQDRVAAAAVVAQVSADRIAQLQANRIDDGLYSTFVVRKLSKPITRLALRLHLRPNAITLISFVVGLAAAASFAAGSRGWLIAGALLLQASLILDCVDGEVARATRSFTALGAWLDALTDRVKEFVVYAGLAIGAVQAGAWQLALALVVLQTTRHMMDYDFAAVQRQREAIVVVRDLRDPTDQPENWTVAFSAVGNPLVRWAKKVIYLPIGERWLIISVVAAIAGGWWALLILLIAGVISFLYVLLGRVLRTRTWHGPSDAASAELLARQSDTGPLLGWIHPNIWSRPAAWSVPVVLRLGELGLVALIVWNQPALLVFGFWWAAIVAFHDYDLLYRALQGQATPRWIIWLGLGWDGRSAVLVIALLAGALATVLGVGIAWLALVFVVLASVQWLVRR